MKSEEIRGSWGSQVLQDHEQNESRALCEVGIEIAAQLAEQTEHLEKLYAMHEAQAKRNAEAHEMNIKHNERDADFWAEKKELELKLLRIQVKMWEGPGLSPHLPPKSANGTATEK